MVLDEIKKEAKEFRDKKNKEPSKNEFEKSVKKTWADAKFYKWKGLADRDRKIHTKIDFMGAGMPEKYWERLIKECDWLEEEKPEEEKEKGFRKELFMFLLTKKRDDATELMVEKILGENKIYTTRNDINEEVWIYVDGIYKPQGKTYIKEIIRNFLEKAYTNQFYNEVLNKIEADTYVESEDFFDVKNIYELPVQNGILNLKTRIISKFTPDKIFFNKLPMTYEPEAKCPEIDKHFKEVLASENDITIIEEVLGNILLKDYRIEKAVMMLGQGRNGKGKTLELIKRFVGADNCSAVALRNMVEDGFFIKDMVSKLVNLSGDLSNTSLKETGCLKQLISRDIIQANRKNKEMINFINYANILFASNELPIVYDSTDGFWTKWILLEFPYKFITQKEYDNLPKEQLENKKIIDPEHIKKISNLNELSGLLNKALDGLDRTLKNNDYSYSTSSGELRNLWIRKSDSFMAFCMDCVELNYEGYITKKELRSKYNLYCKIFGKLKGMSDKSIKITLQNEYGSIDSFKFMDNYSAENLNNKRQVPVWEGVKLIDNIDDFFKKSKIKYVKGGIPSPIGNLISIGSSKTPINLLNVTNFKVLKKIDPFVILRDEKPVEMALKQSETYQVSILGDDWANTLQILLKGQKIEVMEKNEENSTK